VFCQEKVFQFFDVVFAVLYCWRVYSERGKPMEAAPFPNRLRAIDLSQSILVHMAQELEFQLGEVIRAVTSNTPSSAMATYQLLQRRWTRYKQLQRHLSTDVQITVRTSLCDSPFSFAVPVVSCNFVVVVGLWSACWAALAAQATSYIHCAFQTLRFTHQVVALFRLKWRHGRHLEPVLSNRKSDSVNRCVFYRLGLLEERSCQISLPSDLKRRSLGLFEVVAPRTKHKQQEEKDNQRYEISSWSNSSINITV